MNAKKQRRRSGGGGGGRRLTKAKAKRKPKYLSLRRQFPANEKDRLESTKRRRLSHDAEGDEGGGGGGCMSEGIDLVPVDRPEEQGEEIEHRDSNDQENDVARFFSAGDGGATSLSVLLDDSSNAGVASCSSEMNNSTSRLDDLSPSSASLTYAYNDGRRRAALVRHALRSRERGSGQEEEKWVCYSKVVERKQLVKEELEVTSSSSRRAAGPIRQLSLKLDYQEIMNAWSDKGPLYIDAAAESSQIVPDVNDDHRSVQHEALNNGLSWGCNMGVWTVPEMVGDVQNGETRANKDEEQETKMMGQREASVLRYKEKRQNRLFSKTIRYQVRKLNAEKRPRIKGRFVKRD